MLLIKLQALLEHNAKVYIAARNKEYVEAAIAELKEATGKDALYLPLNLASLASVREAAEEFLRYQILKPVYNSQAYWRSQQGDRVAYSLQQRVSRPKHLSYRSG